MCSGPVTGLYRTGPVASIPNKEPNWYFLPKHTCTNRGPQQAYTIRERGEVKRKNKIIQPNPAQINNELWHASDWATLMDWELHMI
jgi:hypothetical protein